jgi:O-antigen chain-terminating methyltransferase
VKEPAKITNPEYSVDRIVARMRESAARQGQLSEGALADVVTSAEFRPSARRASGPLAELKIQPLKLQPGFQPHSDGRYHVDDLLKYHDRDFIQNAYRAILKRGPDAVGYKAFIESLRSGRLNKVDILARLRYSAEGRAKQVEIEGLRMPAIIRKAYRVPVIGYLLNLAVALARLPLMIRNEQQFSAHVLAQQEIVVEHLNRIDRSLHSHAAEVSQALELQSESGRSLGDELHHQVNQSREQFDLAQQQLSQLTEHTDQQQSALRQEVSDQLAHQSRDIELRTHDLAQQLTSRLRDESAQREDDMGEIAKRVGQASAHWQENFESFESRLQIWQEDLRVAAMDLHQADLGQREQLELTTKDLRSEVERTAKSLKLEIERVFQKQQEVNSELVLQGERLATLLLEARKRLPKPFDKAQLEAIAREEDHRLDAFYASFDEQFRGSREEIKRRLLVYLPIIKERGIGSETMPLLDVGCGRGEWLELLKDEHLNAKGVDSNRVLVEWCRNRDLEVAEDDLISCLHRQPDSSLGAVSGFHIIEHLPIETLVEFLNQTVRVLKPGGVVIFETPNPQNVLVGSCNFYFDPTHRNPLPSQVTKFLLESRGFVGVEVLNLNPSDDTPVDENSELARRFNKYFYGPMDYAVVGYRP